MHTEAMARLDWIFLVLLTANVLASGSLAALGLFSIYKNHLRQWWRPLMYAFTLMAGADSMDTFGRLLLRYEHIVNVAANPISHDPFRIFTTLSSACGWVIMLIVVLVYFSPLTFETKDTVKIIYPPD